ncbi:MAG: hypothetical protein LBH43_02020 [Treponema sp.]|jgi:hypothetical protein|nr:hypothetical protein [Treponema sp.]
MKKIQLLLIICLVVLPLSVYAQDADSDSFWENAALWPEDDSVWENDPFWIDTGTVQKKDNAARNEPQKPRMKNRGFEIGLVNLDIGIANNFLAASEFFQETFVIDMDEFKKGLNMGLNFMISPFHFQYNKDDNWGFGLATNVEGALFANLSGDMLSISEAADKVSDIGGGIFAETGVNAFFHVKQFKVKVKPALYFPIVYVKQPAMSYTRKTITQNDGTRETVLDVSWTMRAYTIGSFENMDNGFNISAAPGIDINLGAEYPLAKVLGLSDKFKFLDFDVGLDFVHVPFIPATMKDYMETSGSIGTGNEPLDILNIDQEKLINISGDPVYGQDSFAALRPFKMLAWADWRPFESPIFTLTPLFGFAINPLYNEVFSIESGLKARLDLDNMFMVTLGINYEDRLWKNSIAFALNLRAVEFDLGLDIRSQDFLKSWQGSGLGVVLGLKFGW